MWTRQKIKELYNYHCAYCGEKSEQLTIDHIIPKSKGGSNRQDNLLPACERCNGLKGSWDLEDFRKQYFGNFLFEHQKS
jgi:5-methylcytosine-specific restriction endonuclease McrA